MRRTNILEVTMVYYKATRDFVDELEISVGGYKVRVTRRI